MKVHNIYAEENLDFLHILQSDDFCRGKLREYNIETHKEVAALYNSETSQDAFKKMLEKYLQDRNANRVYGCILANAPGTPDAIIENLIEAMPSEDIKRRLFFRENLSEKLANKILAQWGIRYAQEVILYKSSAGRNPSPLIIDVLSQNAIKKMQEGPMKESLTTVAALQYCKNEEIINQALKTNCSDIFFARCIFNNPAPKDTEALTNFYFINSSPNEAMKSRYYGFSNEMIEDVFEFILQTVDCGNEFDGLQKKHIGAFCAHIFEEDKSEKITNKMINRIINADVENCLASEKFLYKLFIEKTSNIDALNSIISKKDFGDNITIFFKNHERTSPILDKKLNDWLIRQSANISKPSTIIEILAHRQCEDNVVEAFINSSRNNKQSELQINIATDVLNKMISNNNVSDKMLNKIIQNEPETDKLLLSAETVMRAKIQKELKEKGLQDVLLRLSEEEYIKKDTLNIVKQIIDKHSHETERDIRIVEGHRVFEAIKNTDVHLARAINEQILEVVEDMQISDFYENIENLIEKFNEIRQTYEGANLENARQIIIKEMEQNASHMR